MEETWKNARAEAAMREAGEKIMKEAREKAEANKPKPLPMGTKVKYNYQETSGEGEIVGLSPGWLAEVNYIVKTESIISEIYPYTTFACPPVNLEVIK